ADIRVEDQGRAVRAVGEAGVARVVEELEAAGATRLLAAPVRIRRIDDEVVVPQVEIAVDVGRLETPLVPRDAAVLGTDVRLDPDRLIDPRDRRRHDERLHLRRLNVGRILLDVDPVGFGLEVGDHLQDGVVLAPAPVVDQQDLRLAALVRLERFSAIARVELEDRIQRSRIHGASRPAVLRDDSNRIDHEIVEATLVADQEGTLRLAAARRAHRLAELAVRIRVDACVGADIPHAARPGRTLYILRAWVVAVDAALARVRHPTAIRPARSPEGDHLARVGAEYGHR